MAGLQHGVPSVSTAGEHTDPGLREAAGKAFFLAQTGAPSAFEQYALALFQDPALRARFSAESRMLYDTSFAFDVTARRLLSAIEAESG